MFVKREDKSWRNLKHLQSRFAKCHIRDLFKQDPLRAEKYTLQSENMYVDYQRRIN